MRLQVQLLVGGGGLPVREVSYLKSDNMDGNVRLANCSLAQRVWLSWLPLSHVCALFRWFSRFVSVFFREAKNDQIEQKQSVLEGIEISQRRTETAPAVLRRCSSKGLSEALSGRPRLH